MKNCIALGATIAAVSLSSPAFAQDAEPDTFDGFYVGGFIAADATNDGARDRIVFDTDGDGVFGDPVRVVGGANAFSPGFCNGIANGPRRSGQCRDDSTDLGYGVKIGYDQRIGAAVVGLLVEGAMSEAVDYSSGFSVTPASYTFSRGLDTSVAMRARFGISPGGGEGLLYATAGLAYAKIDHGFITTNTANSFEMVDGDKWQLGAQLGMGAEIQLARNITWGMEFLHSKYRDDDAYVLVGPGTAPPTNAFLIRSGSTRIAPSDRYLRLNSFRSALTFRF